MASSSKLSSCFLGYGWATGLNPRHSDVRFFPLPRQRLLPASCKMRQRNLSSQPRRQTKKVSPDPLPTNTNFQQIVDEETEPGTSDTYFQQIVDEETEPGTSDTNFQQIVDEETEPETSDTNIQQIVDEETEPGTSDTDKIPTLNLETSEADEILSLNPENSDNILSSSPETSGTDNILSSSSETLETENILNLSPETTETDNILSLNPDSISDGDGDGIDTTVAPEETSEKEVNGLTSVKEIKPTLIDDDGGEQLSGVRLQDLISMIKNAEKNIALLNLARLRALEDLGVIVHEKRSLQEQISDLEMRLAESDARLKAAAHEKVHVDLLGNQLKKLQSELSTRDSGDGALALETFSPSYSNSLDSLTEEFDILKNENISLKENLEDMKKKFGDIKRTDERVLMLENERSFLESALKDLELKLAVSEEDVSKVSGLQLDYQSLLEKVENLQVLLDKATKQADQAISLLQQNQDLRKKVDRLEESLDEVNVYKSTSEKLQQYNELMQQKIKLLDERLQKSDEEIHSHVQLYQESVLEFQDTLNILKEESKKRAVNEPVNDMPWEFWSRLLLMIDGWFLEKKISTNEATTLREMVRKRDARICEAYITCKEQNEGEVISIFVKLASTSKRAGLHVIHIAAEMAPVAKVGGLGDVVTGLGKALQKRGHLVEIVIPKYDCMQYEHIHDLRALDVLLESYFDGRLFKNKVWVGTVEGLPVYFIEPEHPNKFFWRGQYYGEPDDFKRFSFFSRAALELIHQAGKRPDIIHCHDWQTAFVAPLYWDIYAPKGLNSARICFTCHNFEYQGSAPASELSSCGLDAQQLNRPDRMQDNSSHDRVNTVKGAIVFSNIVTTVSPTYAQEVRTAEGGKGLHSTINSHSKKFSGILNGIDYDSWNPATDKFLKVQFSVNDLQGKVENKEALRRQLGLSSTDVRRPLVGCITRLVPQKGVHLIRHSLFRTLGHGGQFVLLGSSPVPDIQREFEELANRFHGHEHCRLILKYDESLSHLIYAASDMLVIPSIFEPCGLTQMIAMRYGSVPVARKTGGLSDSVFDVDDDSVPAKFKNGYTFEDPTEKGLSTALDRALKLYASDSERWERLVQHDMRMDFSWDASARQYEDLYETSVARARASDAE